MSEDLVTSRNNVLAEEHDLLSVIKIPFEDPATMYFAPGADGFPAYGLLPGSDVKAPYRLTFPETLYKEFALVGTVKVNTAEGGFLFALVNPLETVVQLGVQLRPVSPGQMNLTLLYTDVTKYSTTQPIASFLIPAPTGKYFKFALKVTTDGVTAFVNCEEIESTRVVRNPQELLFDSASTLYLGQAGPIIKGALDV
ncbi:hypothetical protein M8J75_003140 [Diaphorina citri]|nr:hypothetical protein M8J75_003140 [Diaphorina citri]